jgi:hypothetical protein
MILPFGPILVQSLLSYLLVYAVPYLPLALPFSLVAQLSLPLGKVLLLAIGTSVLLGNSSFKELYF